MATTSIDVEQSGLNKRPVVTRSSSYYENEKATSNDNRSGEDELGKAWQPEDA